MYGKHQACFLGHGSRSILVEILAVSHYLSSNGSGVLELRVTMFLDPKLESHRKEGRLFSVSKVETCLWKRGMCPSLPQTKLILQWKARSTKSQLLAPPCREGTTSSFLSYCFCRDKEWPLQTAWQAGVCSSYCCHHRHHCPSARLLPPLPRLVLPWLPLRPSPPLVISAASPLPFFLLPSQPQLPPLSPSGINQEPGC